MLVDAMPDLMQRVWDDYFAQALLQKRNCASAMQYSASCG